MSSQTTKRRCECGEPYYAKGYCKKHYQDQRLRPDYDPVTDRRSAYHRERNTGCSQALAERLRALQGGVCGMPGCGVVMNVSNRRLKDGEQADHDHATGEVRGLLCAVCNRALGAYEKLRGRAELYLANPPATALRSAGQQDEPTGD